MILLMKNLFFFSKSNFERAIPSIMDDLKPDQCKIIFVCFTKHLICEIKVEQISCFRVPDDGQLDICLYGGDGGNAAFAHYIFTRLSPLAL
ncbi:unnamed protein product [Rotaria sp. Silwood2]|nr:unnamed protein product [Rotaria sp. Silwood2]CAF3512187.1 unnamed protein product [Rotaria sp. Silwood2]CAF4409773.1 unnamed protein product [Rotaria sp. Silwood2]CAF4737758.1 unnamed protein product [Rotaria sp. Silwood2]